MSSLILTIMSLILSSFSLEVYPNNFNKPPRFFILSFIFFSLDMEKPNPYYKNSEWGQQPSLRGVQVPAPEVQPWLPARPVLPPQQVEAVLERAPAVRPPKHRPNPQSLGPVPEERGDAFHHVRGRHAPALPRAWLRRCNPNFAVPGTAGAGRAPTPQLLLGHLSPALSSPTTAVDAAVFAAVPVGVAQHSNSLRNVSTLTIRLVVVIETRSDLDVYDLELTAVKDNTQLRKLLIETTSKSIIVIEDIDCSEDLSGKRKPKKEDKEGDEQPPAKPDPPANKESDEKGSKVTLSGLLNFIDGLWSTSCGGERLIVFTTNHIEKLDPALIRTGRMDVQVEMSYCCFEAFKVLAKSYLLLEDHPLFGKVREALEVEGVKMTPADVAENLTPKTSSSRAAGLDTAGICLRSLVQALEKAKIQAEGGGKEGEVASTVN